MNTLQQHSDLGAYTSQVDGALDEIGKERILPRIWEMDHTVWSPEPTEITNRLGWLNIASAMQGEIADIARLVQDVRAAGYTHAVLLGMGGSSLAPEVFYKTFGTANGYLHLLVLDSTDPGAVLSVDRSLDLRKALFIVATKSGGTVETLSGFKYFYNKVVEVEGAGSPGDHFIAITDPGSSLIALAAQYHFRRIFQNDPNIGGRYSALSHFGLVPAALIGVDLSALLDRANQAASENNSEVQVSDSPAAWLGVALGELAKSGRDKITFLTSTQVASFGDWAEQLIAESTGKNGKGILPVVGEEPGNVGAYGPDRVFVHLQLLNSSTHSILVSALKNAGHPVIEINLKDKLDLGGQFFLWEFATAIAGQRLGIQPFDQPNVEAAKILAREVVTEYMKSGSLPSVTPILTDNDFSIFTESPVKGHHVVEIINSFLGLAQPGAYIAVQAYVQSGEQTEKALQTFRANLRNRTKLATTLGYGPRFLHSTGQLHKGDAGKGLFIQITVDDLEDVAIPDEAGKSDATMKFGVLKLSQALGDALALQNGKRAVIRLHIGGDFLKGLQTLTSGLSA